MEEAGDESVEARLADVGPAQWAAIAEALDAVEAAGGPYAVWSSIEPTVPGGPYHLPYPRYTQAVDALIRALIDADVSIVFDWMRWPGYLDQWTAERVAEGSVADAVRMITTALRAERFVDGFQDGLLVGGVLQAATRKLLEARPASG